MTFSLDDFKLKMTTKENNIIYLDIAFIRISKTCVFVRMENEIFNKSFCEGFDHAFDLVFKNTEQKAKFVGILTNHSCTIWEL